MLLPRFYATPDAAEVDLLHVPLRRRDGALRRWERALLRCVAARRSPFVPEVREPLTVFEIVDFDLGLEEEIG